MTPKVGPSSGINQAVSNTTTLMSIAWTRMAMRRGCIWAKTRRTRDTASGSTNWTDAMISSSSGSPPRGDGQTYLRDFGVRSEPIELRTELCGP